MTLFRLTGSLPNASIIVAWLTIIRLLLPVHAQEEPVEVPEPNSFYRRQWQEMLTLNFSETVAVIGEYLYIEGGEILQYPEGSRELTVSPSNVTLSIPLHEPWSNDTVEFREINKGRKSAVHEHNLWVDKENNRIYQWDGSDRFPSSTGAEDPQLWAFLPQEDGGGAWETVSPENPNVYNGLLRVGSATGAACGEMAYDLGGFVRSRTDNRVEGGISIPSPGMITLNMTSREWRNQSLAAMSPPFGIYMRGAASCVTGFNDKAYLMTTGGWSSSRVDAFKDLDRLSFSNITFYDQDSQTWHWQQTSSSSPPNRAEHCAVGVQSSYGTYEIYVYGGNSDATGQFDDFWVLSLPGFRWFQINVRSPFRHGHSCALVGNSQIISVGGHGDDVDPWKQSLGVFDLSTLTWSDRFDPDAAAYKPPKVIEDWYKEGGFDKVNWSSDKVKGMFSSASPPFEGSPSNDGEKKPSPSNDPNDDGGEDIQNSSTNVGAIAGGVVAGVAAIAIIVGGLFFWRRRRVKSLAQSQLTRQPYYYQQTINPGEHMAYSKPTELDVPTGHAAAVEVEAENRLGTGRPIEKNKANIMSKIGPCLVLILAGTVTSNGNIE
ncbi:Kelch repeat-containing protein [Paramyrothecium foliicola]|nr:Kelch repeat-containing protein [Paramyrothecium foliicola]